MYYDRNKREEGKGVNFACRETEWEIKSFPDVLERGKGGGGGRGRNKTSYDVLPWTIWITSGHLLIDKIVEDDLKTTDKTLQVFIDKNIGQQLK